MRTKLVQWAFTLVAIHANGVLAQSTAGTGTTIVVPVTAQTASFTSEVTAFNPNGSPITVDVAFYEANNSPTPGPRTCADIVIPANRSVQFALATQCTLSAGSHFGLLVLSELTETKPFYGYARTQNPQGIGFSIEGFPDSNFNDQVSHATGLKKTVSGLVYQTNCFVGSLAQPVSYTLKLFNDASGVQIGGTLAGSLGAFQQFRYLDIFGPAGVNAPAANQLNVRAEFTPTNAATLIGFCTVQDNTSFGADFRIAKSYGTPGTVTNILAGTGLTGGVITGVGTIAVDTAVIQSRVTGSCAAGSSIRAIAANGTVTCETDDTGGGPGNAFVQGGNAFGATAVLGTTDAQNLWIKVNGLFAMRYERNAISPNLVGGTSSNVASAGTLGVVIGGGGAMGTSVGFPSGGSVTCPAGCQNLVGDTFGTIGGGLANRAGDDAGLTEDQMFATVSGGFANTASGPASTVSGGSNNTVSGSFGTVGGGTVNIAPAYATVVGGGERNTASGATSAIAGGSFNDATATGAFIGGGFGNTASGSHSVVGGGFNNQASGYRSTVGGGDRNIASGYASAAVGGSESEAAGKYSVAMGRRSKANGDGSFSFADSNNFDFNTNTDNSFRVRATGGVRFVTGIDGTGATTWSCLATDGNGWSCSSDRNLKQNLLELDGRAVLAKVAAMPIYQWQPKGKNAHVKHFGPMAQDFMAAFGLGDNDKMIGMQDADGVALAAIQGLNAKLEAQVAEQARAISELRSQSASEVAELKRMVEVLLARTSPEGRVAAAR